MYSTSKIVIVLSFGGPNFHVAVDNPGVASIADQWPSLIILIGNASEHF